MSQLAWIIKIFFYLLSAWGVIEVISDLLVKHWIWVYEWGIFTGVCYGIARLIGSPSGTKSGANFDLLEHEEKKRHHSKDESASSQDESL